MMQKASRSECLADLRTAKLDSSEHAGENIRYGGRQVTGKSDTDSVKIGVYSRVRRGALIQFLAEE